SGRKRWVDRDLEAIIGQQVVEQLNEDELKILNFLSINGEMSVTDGVRVISMSWGTVKKKMEALESRGIIARRINKAISKDAQARYYLVGAPRAGPPEAP